MPMQGTPTVGYGPQGLQEEEDHSSGWADEGQELSGVLPNVVKVQWDQ